MVVWKTHRMHCVGGIQTLKKVQIDWHWLGTSSDVKWLICTCEVCKSDMALWLVVVIDSACLKAGAVDGHGRPIHGYQKRQYYHHGII